MKKVYSSFVLLTLLGTGAQAFEYKVSGSLQTFSKVGFNNQSIDKNANRYPTDSFMNIVGTLQTDMVFIDDENKKLTGSVGALAGGTILDSSRHTGNSIIHGSGGQYVTANFVLYNAYIDYTAKKNDHNFEVKIGRYASQAQFMSGFTQGFEAKYTYKNFDLWWFSSYGRGFANAEWIYSFYTPKSFDKNGNYGIHAFKPSYSFDSGLYISPFVYFSPDFYVAPMLELGFDSNKKFDGQGFRSTTKVFFMSPFHTSNVQNIYRYQSLSGKGGQTIAIRQQFDINNFHFGGGWYQNFGNANAHVGTYGNAAIGGWDFWTNTAYDFGALTNAITKDAKTGYIFLGAAHGKFEWETFGRMTFSPRADEQAALVSFSYSFPYNIKLWLKLEWQNVTTHAGYIVATNTTGSPASIAEGRGSPVLEKSIKEDRSHAMMLLSYSF
ncbi:MULTISPECIES: outer membrane family protein [unclassified Helicobacter]|uniref:outer membrane family protein n=1 Tax=unclassified Helicobacter TaxID=2593540 RepID=UPI000CF1C153|nr:MULTISPECIES: outer membrane family protein [unclassified Helicobacter]